MILFGMKNKKIIPRLLLSLYFLVEIFEYATKIEEKFIWEIKKYYV